MDSKNKNILIGGLIAIVLIMAVGYAAFATTLRINGTAEITSSWNVHFDGTKTGGATVVEKHAGISGGAEPATTKTGQATDVVYSNNNLTATIYTGLAQPGDYVIYTFTILNEGSLKAIAGTPDLVVTDSDYTSQDGKTVRKGNIQYEITQLPTPGSIAATNGTATMKVKVSYIDLGTGTCTGYTGSTAPTTSSDCTAANGTWNEPTTGNTTTQQTASATITLVYTQDTSNS